MNINDKINYVEFPARDIPATKAFFEAVFGWSFDDYGPEYAAFSDRGIDGGFFHSDLASSTASGGALIVLYSDDLEDLQNRVVQGFVDQSANMHSLSDHNPVLLALDL